jgi:hypothetical protein
MVRWKTLEVFALKFSAADLHLHRLHDMDKRTKQLFEWAASNSTPDTPVTPSKTLDPSIIDSILGPDDATLMLESMKAIKDTSLSLSNR